MSVTTTVFERLDGLGALVWRAVAADYGLYCSDTWLRGFEAPSSRYLHATEDGRSVAVAVCSSEPASAVHPFYSLQALQRRLPAVADAPPEVLAPTLIFGPPAGFQNRLLLRPELSAEGRTAALRSLLATTKDMARDAGAPVVFFPYLPLEDAAEVLKCCGDGALAGYATAETYLPLAASFEDYVSMHSKAWRYKIRREMKQFAEEGLVVEIRHLAECMAEVVALHDPYLEKYYPGADRQALKEALIRTQFMNLAREIDDRTRVFLTRSAGRVGGFCLFVKQGDVYYSRAVGLDHSILSKRSASYFNSNFYEPIRHGMQEGIREIHYSLGSLEAKLFRGCRVRPLFFVLWPQRGPFPESLRKVVRASGLDRLAQAVELVGRCGAHPDQAAQDLGPARAWLEVVPR